MADAIEIPEGADVVRNDDGEVLYWRNAAEDQSQIDGYEAKFDRLGTHRRVLGFVTDEVDQDATDDNASRFLVSKDFLGPRNTVGAIAFAMARDSNSPHVAPHLDEASQSVGKALDELEAAGLVESQDGRYSVTDAGRDELRN